MGRDEPDPFMDNDIVATAACEVTVAGRERDCPVMRVELESDSGVGGCVFCDSPSRTAFLLSALLSSEMFGGFHFGGWRVGTGSSSLWSTRFRFFLLLPNQRPTHTTPTIRLTHLEWAPSRQQADCPSCSLRLEPFLRLLPSFVVVTVYSI